MIIALQALYLFQKSLLTIFELLFEPYLKNIFFYDSNDVYIEEDSDDEVYAEFDDNKGVVFYPPVYAQRYAAVSDCLLDGKWRGQLEKVIDFGCNNMSFIKYLKDIPGVREILGIDLEPIWIPLELKFDRYCQKREHPLKITLYEGNAADPDYRLIGSDAVISIEMIEHMQPQDLERFVHNVFGFVKPWVVVITTPNGDFNVLFKELQKNGLRRLDHMFEWSRDQFHDWCSNIVLRYPDYTVNCKGIAPGPTGTSHLGCCSQLALFVAKNYQKQTKLNPNSLAIVERDSGSGMSDSMDSWDMTESVLDNSNKSLTTYKYESVSFITSVPSLSNNKKVQCNINDDYARNYLMFEEDTFNIRYAREQFISVYYIENVANRLNCTNNQVKKFSKTTHQLLAKNNLDTLVNAKDVVSDIRHLCRVANPESREFIWNNINWGEDAPYWNKYYKIIKEYSHPFVAKSDETRLLELVSEEINRLKHSSEEYFLQEDKMEIPIGYIMGIVSHITDDEDKVKELLEWNGYDVIGDTVVYTKLVDDSTVVDAPKDWIDVTSMSDWSTTDSQSLAMLDGVTESDMFEYDLQMSLDQKIRSLQKLSRRMDISAELERVFCRLVNLVQDTRSSKSPPQPLWLLNQLYDLLTVTEKAMMRQRKHFIGDCKRAIKFSKRYKEDQNVTISIGIEKTCKPENILDRYESVLLGSDNDQSYDHLIEYVSSDELITPFKTTNENLIQENLSFDEDPENKAILQSYDSLYEELELRDVNYRGVEKAEMTTYTDKIVITNSCNKATEYLQSSNDDEEVIVIKAKPRKRQNKYREHKNKLKHKKYKKIRKFTSFAPGYMSYFKNETVQYHQQKVCAITQQLNYKTPKTKSIKPIPSSLMNLFNTSQNRIEVNQISSIGDLEFSEHESIMTVKPKEETSINTITSPDEIYFNTDDVQTKVAMSGSRIEETNNKEEIEHTPVLFLNDINEPSTSNGIRHISADVQCGPDDAIDVSQTRSTNYMVNFTPKRLNTDLKIQASISDFQNTIGTSTINDVSNKSESLITNNQNNERDDIEADQLVKMESVPTRVIKKQVAEKRDKVVNLGNPKTNNKRYLSCGGIYVHCYKDRNSEDIVYQGKWQEFKRNDTVKKPPIILYRKRKEMIVKKKIVITEKDLINKISTNVHNGDYRRKISYRNSMQINTAHRKPEKHGFQQQNNAKKKVRLVKPSLGLRPLETSTPVTKFLDTSSMFDIKNYIPAYLKKRINKQPLDKKLNLNLNIVLNTYKEDEHLEKLQLKPVKDKQTARHKSNSYVRRIPTYQVYRNEIDTELIDVRGAEDEKLKKCVAASTSTYVPCTSCSNNVTFCNRPNYGIGYSSERSSSDNYEPGNYRNKNKRLRKLKSIKNFKSFATKFEDIQHTTESARSLETERSPYISSGVELIGTSIDLSFSSSELLGPKKIANSASNTHSNNNTQTSENAYKLEQHETEKSDKDDNVDKNSENNIKREIRFLIDDSLSQITKASTVKNANQYLEQVTDETDSLYSEYTSTLTVPTSSAAKTEIFNRYPDEIISKSSFEYSNIDSGVQDVELLSPISVVSVTTSKLSEYLSADNELDDDFSSMNSNSIFSIPRNCFDLNDNISKIDNAVLPVDILNAADGPDNNMCLNVDSEIRSNQDRARRMPRQLSERSSEDTYVSCSTDDEPQVPYWLFESDSEPERVVASSPQEDEIEDTEDEEEDETEDDTQDVAVVGIGAGDGRGIHSDVSRDTSGRGTSLSSGMSSLESQETLSNSSSQQSEYSVQPQNVPESIEISNEPAENINNTPNLPPAGPVNVTDVDGDASSLDNEYELDSETSYSTI